MPPVNMIDPASGKTFAVEPADVAGLQQGGWKVESASGNANRVVDERLDEDYGGVGGTIAAGALGAARGFTGGLSDVALADGEGARDLRRYKERHEIASTVGEVGGALGGALTGGGVAGRAAQLGARLSEAGEGASLLARAGRAALGYGTEGAIQGLGQGVSELAMSDDPLDAERVASVLSSNALLGGAIGGAVGAGSKVVGNIAERTLSRAARSLEEVSAARAGLSEIPEDLAAMDAKALRAAAAEEKAAIRSQVSAEREGLEAERVPLRKQVAEEVEVMHREMMDQRPIFKAVAGADVREIDGVKDIASQLNKSYRGMRSAFDNPISIAENPEKLIGHLQMRQTALESLQKKANEIRTVLGSDARAEALIHVDDALAQTKNQIDTIKSLGRTNPVSSAKLSELEGGLSPRLRQIEAAQDALQMAPDAGILQKGAQGAAFAGATALAHAIPGVGIAAPFVGKWASDTIGKVFEHLAGARSAVAGGTASAIQKFLSVGGRVAAPTTRTAATVLREVRFGESKDAGQGLAGAYKARSAELRNQTAYTPQGTVAIRPEARQAIAKRLAPIAQVNPLLADKLETIQVRKTEFLSSVMPRRPDIGGLQIGPDNWSPNSLDIRSWARSVRAVEDPASVEEDLANGIMTPEAAVAYRTVYPERFAALQQAVYSKAPTLSKTLPMSKKIALSIFTGVPLTPAMQPNVLAVLQGNFAVEQEAPKPQPNFGALGSARSPDKQMTSAQQREQT